MRVLYFSYDYTPHDHRFLAALADSEHEVFYLRLQRGPRQTEDRAVPSPVRQIPWIGGTRPFRWRDFPKLFASFRGVVREIKPDLIHAGPIQTVALFPALLGFHPLVSMSWGSDLLRDAEKSAVYRKITRFVLRKSDVLVADCETVARKATEFGFAREKVVVFPWGVDLRHFSPGDDGGLRRRLGWEDDFVVLHNRSWEPIYGVDVMARAFVRAARAEPRLRLMLLGGGSLAPLLHRIFHDANMLDRVHFFGQVAQRDLPRYYRAADIYLSASHSDGSSVSLMEALASGLPALVSDIPSNREWIRPGVEGWLFPDGDVAGLSRELLKIAHLPAQELQVLSRNARTRAEERADWSYNFAQLLKAYQIAARSVE